MNGDSFSLLANELLRPLNAVAEGLFVTGCAYGAKQLADFLWLALKGVRTFFIPLGRRSRLREFGQWAGRCLAIVVYLVTLLPTLPPFCI